MPDVMDEFAHLKDKTIGELNSRYQHLKTSAPVQQLPEDALRELIAISRILRGRAVAPTAKKNPSKAAPTLDAL